MREWLSLHLNLSNDQFVELLLCNEMKIYKQCKVNNNFLLLFPIRIPFSWFNSIAVFESIFLHILQNNNICGQNSGKCSKMN